MTPPTLWTPRQRWTVLGSAVILLVGLMLARAWDRTVVPDPPGDGPRSADLATRFDPNTADADALAALPGLGEARAHAIVDYRTDYARRHGGRPAFARPSDLLPVKGVGVSTVDNLEPYLTFPPPSPTGTVPQ